MIVSNAIAAYLRPSIYDCIIHIKRLPYLPEMGTIKLAEQGASQPVHEEVQVVVTARKLMSHTRHLSRTTTYEDILRVLEDRPNVKHFPVVDKNSKSH